VRNCSPSLPLPLRRKMKRLALLGRREERLPFFDDIRGEFRGVAAADVAHRVDYPGRDGQSLASVVHLRRLVLDLILHRPFEDIDDLFARMRAL
jgi:hypothetical protein